MPSGDQATLNRVTEARSFGRSRQLMHHLRRGARALGGLLGHREDVLDVGRHLVGLLSFPWRAWPEIRTISSSSSRDTRSMSSSALPAASDSCVPSTTRASSAPWRPRRHGCRSEWPSRGRRFAASRRRSVQPDAALLPPPPRSRDRLHRPRRGLDGGVQGQHVRLFRNVRDQLRDLADFL